MYGWDCEDLGRNPLVVAVPARRQIYGISWPDAIWSNVVLAMPGQGSPWLNACSRFHVVSCKITGNSLMHSWLLHPAYGSGFSHYLASVIAKHDVTVVPLSMLLSYMLQTPNEVIQEAFSSLLILIITKSMIVNFPFSPSLHFPHFLSFSYASCSCCLISQQH